MCIIKSVTITSFEKGGVKMNYSRQREAILEVLRGTTVHPTASQVHKIVQEKIPNISLGTVYRNLSLLVENGDVLCISVGDGNDHFDGDNTYHLHLRCKKCGGIEDAAVSGESVFSLAREKGFVPTGAICVIHGVCKNCNQ